MYRLFAKRVFFQTRKMLFPELFLPEEEKIGQFRLLGAADVILLTAAAVEEELFLPRNLDAVDFADVRTALALERFDYVSTLRRGESLELR